jgi:hypothetical protein
MSGDVRGSSRGGSKSSDAAAFRRFRRARSALWALSAISVALGATLHDWASRSTVARVAWFGALALALGHPLSQLLRFRCPRCHNVFLATGGWRDFLGLGRILWSNRCGRCALPIANEGTPSSSRVPESRPV